jgi:hypothetical protein
MPSNDYRVERSLPARWPRRARSAILHAVFVARVALLAATDRIAVSVRLEHELALLRDELRFKDARMRRARRLTAHTSPWWNASRFSSSTPRAAIQDRWPPSPRRSELRSSSIPACRP